MIYLLQENTTTETIYNVVSYTVGMGVMIMLFLVLFIAISLVVWKWWTEWRHE